VLSDLANDGFAGRPGLTAIFDLRDVVIQADGSVRIDPSRHQNPHIGFTFPQQNDDKAGGLIPALEGFMAEAVALGGAGNRTFGGVSNEEPHNAQAKYDAYMSRLKILRDAAEHDGYTLNLPSEVDFKWFIQSYSDIRRGNLVLMDNGNLRAVWKDEQGAHLGLQFLGGGMVQYVIFKRRRQEQPVSRISGRDSLEGLERQIDAFELHSLLCE